MYVLFWGNPLRQRTVHNAVLALREGYRWIWGETWVSSWNVQFILAVFSTISLKNCNDAWKRFTISSFLTKQALIVYFDSIRIGRIIIRRRNCHTVMYLLVWLIILFNGGQRMSILYISYYHWLYSIVDMVGFYMASALRVKCLFAQ